MSGKTRKPHYDMYDMYDSDWRAFVFIYSSGQYFKTELVQRNDGKLTADLIVYCQPNRLSIVFFVHQIKNTLRRCLWFCQNNCSNNKI